MAGGRKGGENEKLTGRIPDCTITIDEWELIRWLVRDDTVLGYRPAASDNVSPLPRVGKLKKDRLTFRQWRVHPPPYPF